MTRTTICRTTCSSSVAPSPPPRLLTTRSNGCETCCATTDVLLIEATGYTGNAHKQPCPHIYQLAQIILANPDHKSHVSASTNMFNSYTLPSVFFLLSHLRLPCFSPFKPNSAPAFTFQQPSARLTLVRHDKLLHALHLHLQATSGALAISQTLNQGQLGGI